MLHTQRVVTELVTNAARHAQTPVELTIATAAGRVRIEARDGSAAFPRDPDFEPKAARALDLYARKWDGKALGKNDFVVSADEKVRHEAP